MNKLTVAQVLEWVKNHKFWTSVIVLIIANIVIGILSFPSLFYTAFFNFVLFYTLVGGLLWSGYSGKKGMTFTALGIYFTMASVYSWWMVLRHFNTVGFFIALFLTFLSALHLFFGNKRYKEWLHNRDQSNA